MTVARRVIRPTDPLRRVQVAAPVGSSSSTPASVRISRRSTSESSWFLGENGSIEGGMIQT